MTSHPPQAAAWEALEAYLAGVRASEWGDQMTLTALQRMTGYRVVIYSLQARQGIVRSQAFEPAVAVDRVPVRGAPVTVRLCFKDRGAAGPPHYDAVLPREALGWVPRMD